jgi:putative membrane protein
MKTPRLLTGLLAATVIAAAALPSLAATSTRARRGQRAGFDLTFVRQAARGGMAEVMHGRLASQKGANEDVREFGRRMVEDHTRANNELKSLAQRKGWRLPADPGPRHRRMQARLQRLSGARFDRVYMRHMVNDHRKTVALFERASRSAQDRDLRAWAAGKLPALREHLAMATDIYRQVGGQPGQRRGRSGQRRALPSSGGAHGSGEMP